MVWQSVVVNWEMNGKSIKKLQGSAVRNEDFYFREGLTWSKISSGSFAARHRPIGFLFDDTGRCGFAPESHQINHALLLFCSKLSNFYLRALCPTLSFTSREIASIPLISSNYKYESASELISISRLDWDSYETSWDFTRLPILEVGSGKWEVGSRKWEVGSKVTQLKQKPEPEVLPLTRPIPHDSHIYEGLNPYP